MRLRLLIDDSPAINQGAGIGRYAREVVPAAVRALSDVDVVLWYAPERPGQAPFLDATLSKFDACFQPRVASLPVSRRRMDQFWYRARIPFPLQVLARARAGVVYSPDFTAPPSGRTPRIVTVHDLAFEICPERAPAGLRRYLQGVVPHQVATATRVIAVSETTRVDLIERYGVEPAKVAVAPNGVEERFFSAQPLTADERISLGLPEQYILTVGTLEPRKNHVTLFRAVEILGSGFDYPLVVAGRPGWETAPILNAAAPLVQAGRVRLLDYVPERLLPGLYAGARCLVYPSWYEGFGLPVLEALAAGIPVVASTAPALKEVAGACARYVDPASAEEIAQAIIEAVRDSERTPDRIEARQRRARRYTWEAAGQAVASVIREVAAG